MVDFKFSLGDKVRYTSGTYTESRRNPLWGGGWGKTVGTVTKRERRSSTENVYSVRWDSIGSDNQYKEEDISLHKAFEPPIPFKPGEKLMVPLDIKAKVRELGIGMGLCTDSVVEMRGNEYTVLKVEMHRGIEVYRFVETDYFIWPVAWFPSAKKGKKSMNTGENLTAGARVIFIDEEFKDDLDSPLWGGKHGKIKGTVMKTGGCNDGYPTIKIKWDNGCTKTLRAYRCRSYNPLTDGCLGGAKDFWTELKPYQKYLGVAALAVSIDYFVLGGKFTNKFKKLAESVVSKIVGTLDKIIDRILPE
jgi:hypothetical protein